MACRANGQTSGPCPSWTFSASTNRIITSGFSYDAAGNLTADGTGTGTHTYQWDAEGRLSSVDSGSTGSYTYNALGHRVLANFSSANHELLFDPSGQLMKGPDPYPVVGPDVFLLPVAGRAVGYYFDSDYYTVFNHVNALGSWTTVSWQDGSVNQDGLYYPLGQAWTSFTRQQRFAGLGHHETETGTL